MSRRSLRRIASLLAASGIAVAFAGCTTIQAARGGPGQRLDPWENWNRKVFNFNEDIDRARVNREHAFVITGQQRAIEP